MGPISYNQVEDLRDALDRHQVAYLFIGKTGAILHGFPDTTQDADLFVRKNPSNGRALTKALRALGFDITQAQAREIERGKDFVQLKNGPFDVDLSLCARRHRAVRGRLATRSEHRRISGLLHRRHHRQQEGIQPPQGSGNTSTTGKLPAVPARPWNALLATPAQTARRQAAGQAPPRIQPIAQVFFCRR